jgi:CRP-like cAMP-binding protein
MNLYAQPPVEEDRLRLAALRLLHDLDEESRDALVAKFLVEDVPTDRHLLEEGQGNSRLFVVLKGCVSVRLPKRTTRPTEVKLATLGAGEIFGEYSLFDEQPVSATVFAAEPSRVAWIERTTLDAFFEERRDAGRRFYDAMLRLLVARLRSKNAELDVVTIG